MVAFWYDWMYQSLRYSIMTSLSILFIFLVLRRITFSLHNVLDRCRLQSVQWSIVVEKNGNRRPRLRFNRIVIKKYRPLYYINRAKTSLVTCGHFIFSFLSIPFRIDLSCAICSWWVEIANADSKRNAKHVRIWNDEAKSTTNRMIGYQHTMRHIIYKTL